MLNTAFNDIIPADKAALDLYPAEHRAEIDAINEWVYPEINSQPTSAIILPRC
jgi:putative glutathione S-transferase